MASLPEFELPPDVLDDLDFELPETLTDPSTPAGTPAQSLLGRAGESVFEQMGAGVIEGAATMTGLMLGDVPAFIVDRLTQLESVPDIPNLTGMRQPFGTVAAEARASASKLLPERLQEAPNTGLKAIARAAGEGVGATLPALAITGPAGLAGSLPLELGLGAISGLSSEVARQAGAGPVGQTVAGIGAPLGASGALAVGRGALGVGRGVMGPLRATRPGQMLRQVAREVTPAATSAQAQRRLAERATRLMRAREMLGPEAIEQGLTSGQELANRSLLDLEDALRNAFPDIGRSVEEGGQNLSETIVRELGQIGTRHGDEAFEESTQAFAQGLVQRLERSLDEAVETGTAGGLDTDDLSILLANRIDTMDAGLARAIGRSIGASVDPDEELVLDAAQIAQAARGQLRISDPDVPFSRFESFVQTNVSRPPSVAFAAGELGEEGAEQISLRSLWDMRSRLLADRRALNASATKTPTQNAQMDLIQNTLDAVEDTLERQPFVGTPSPEKVAEARALSRQWREFIQRMRQGPAGRVREMSRRAPFGDAQLSRAGAEFFRPNGAGGRESAEGFVRAFRNPESGVIDPEATSDLAGFALRSMVNRAGVGGRGRGRSVAENMDRFLKQHSQALEQLPPAVRRRLEAVRDLQRRFETTRGAARSVLPEIDNILSGNALQRSPRSAIQSIARANRNEADRMLEQATDLLGRDQTGAAMRGFRRAIFEELADQIQGVTDASASGTINLGQQLSRRVDTLEHVLLRVNGEEHVRDLRALVEVSRALGLQGQRSRVKEIGARFNPTFFELTFDRLASRVRQIQGSKVSPTVGGAEAVSRLLRNLSGATDRETLRVLLSEALYDRRLARDLVAASEGAASAKRRIAKTWPAALGLVAGREQEAE